MSTHKANANKIVFALVIIILFVRYICVKYILLKNPFHYRMNC
jgi:hypothetical protein